MVLTLAGVPVLSALASVFAFSKLFALPFVTFAAFANAFACVPLVTFTNVFAYFALAERSTVTMSNLLVGLVFLSVIGKDTGALGHTCCS